MRNVSRNIASGSRFARLETGNLSQVVVVIKSRGFIDAKINYDELT